MTRILGYLAPGTNAAQIADYADYTGRSGPGRGPVEPTAGCCLAPFTQRANGSSIGISGRPLWRGMAVDEENHATILGKILKRYRGAGANVLADLQGPFAIAIVDSETGRALLAVDRLGIERLTYATSDKALLFATSANSVANFPGVDKSLRDQALFDFLFMHMIPAPGTVYANVNKLPPATALQFEAGRVSIDRYWEPDFQRSRTDDFDALQLALTQGMTAGVNDSGIDASTGAFLSGGLDSSAVAGTLANVTDSPIKTFTVGFGEAEEYDELKYSRITNRHFGCEAFEYQMSPADIVDAFPRIAAAYDEPFGNSSAAPTYFCAKLAADNGITHLLAGDGGDELFGGNERYTRQSIFEMYGRLPAWLKQAIIEPGTRLISTESRITPLRKLRSYVDQASIPLPDRFESWNFMYREGGERMLDADFARSIDTEAPLRLMREVWRSAPADDPLDRMLYYDWRFTLADNDLRKVGTMCELAGVRVSYPLLHQDVVAMSTRVPSPMKIRGTELRSFFKRAMRDFLAAETIDKKKHGFGLPFGLWLKTDANLADLIYSSLADLKKRGYIAADFIDTLIDQHRDGHASYFGYAIWDLAMLEAWLAEHTGPPGPS